MTHKEECSPSENTAFSTLPRNPPESNVGHSQEQTSMFVTRVMTSHLPFYSKREYVHFAGKVVSFTLQREWTYLLFLRKADLHQRLLFTCKLNT